MRAGKGSSECPNFSAGQKGQGLPTFQPGYYVWLEKEELSQNIKFQKESAPLLAIMVSGLKPLNYQNAEYAFSDSGQRIDIILLKWVNYAGIDVFFLMVFIYLCYGSGRRGIGQWQILFSGFLWILYLKQFAFQDTEKFPFWLLPGKWSDMKGWQALLSALKGQIQYLIHFQESPFIQGYYNGICKSLICLGSSFFFFHFFFQYSYRQEAPKLAHLTMAALSVFVSIYNAGRDLKMLLYFFPVFMACFYNSAEEISKSAKSR